MKTAIKTISTILLLGSALSAEGLTLTSNDLHGQISADQVYDGFGCKGNNISPQLSWSGVPKGTKSFAVTIYDPDAPTGSGWWHWVVFDIPKDTVALPANASKDNMPKGAIQSKTDYGNPGFGGACPPMGDKAHRYITTVYALDVEKLGLDANTDSAMAGYTINSHTIEKSSIITYFKR